MLFVNQLVCMRYTEKYMKNMSVRLGILAALAGFILMVFELAAARILAPTIGSSTYVWTSVIGVIIMALSLGYWAGGRIADKRSRLSDIALLFLVLGAAIAVTTLLYQGFLASVAEWDIDVRIRAVVASLILFAPASFLLGAISPYLAKLNVRSLDSSGSAVANLGALNSLGGIVGTFLTGFVLFNVMGARAIMVSLAIASLVIAWRVGFARTRRNLAASVVVVCLVVLTGNSTGVFAIDTATAHYTIEDVTVGERTLRLLATGPGGKQSGVYMDNPGELAFWYTQQMAAAVELQPEAGRIAVLGGGAYTLPMYLANKYPDTQIDVVEIDPQLLAIAKEHFGFRELPNITVYAEDARTFINRMQNTYDIVLVDVFGDDSIPLSMLTAEYGNALGSAVRSDGVVVLNAIAGSNGPCAELFDAIMRPYLDNFAKGYYLPYNTDTVRTNIVSVFGSSPVVAAPYRDLGSAKGPIYTDDFNPVTQIQFDCRR
ncbi:hypothetical protein EOL96_03615 [Candidatus Saccharibacteria bacterium]|nr:hypothetical protein [Candidatus Saccharibacteria bacterium]